MKCCIFSGWCILIKKKKKKELSQGATLYFLVLQSVIRDSPRAAAWVHTSISQIGDASSIWIITGRWPDKRLSVHLRAGRAVCCALGRRYLSEASAPNALEAMIWQVHIVEAHWLLCGVADWLGRWCKNATPAPSPAFRAALSPPRRAERPPLNHLWMWIW